MLVFLSMLVWHFSPTSFLSVIAADRLKKDSMLLIEEEGFGRLSTALTIFYLSSVPVVRF